MSQPECIPPVVLPLGHKPRQSVDPAAPPPHTSDLAFLAKTSESLAGSADESGMLEGLAQIAVESFADLCVIDLAPAEGPRQHVARVHRDPLWLAKFQARDARYPPGQGLLEGLVHTAFQGQPLRIADLNAPVQEPWAPTGAQQQDLLALNLRSILAVPLMAHGHRLGVICLARGACARRYSADDLTLAADLARRAAVSVLNARLLQALRDADRMKDVFLATLAHELRNPLAPIAAGLSILQRVPGDRVRVEQVTAMIGRQVQQLTRLLDDLLGVARIASGKMPSEPTPIPADSAGLGQGSEFVVHLPRPPQVQGSG